MALDSAGTLVWVNGAAAAFLGFPAEQIVGRAPWDLYPATGAPLLREAVERVLTEQIELAFREHFVARGLWVDLRLVPSATGLTIFGRNITAAGPREPRGSTDPAAVVRRTEELHRAFIEHAGEGFWLTDSDGRCLELNDAACQILGYARGELLGQDLRELTHPDDLSRRPIELERLRRGETVRAERRMRRKDGRYVRIEGMGRAFDGSKFLIFFRDVTQSRLAEEALARSERSLHDAQRLAGLGSWTLDLRTGDAQWSEQMYELFQLDPAQVRPSLSLAQKYIHPEDWPKVEAQVHSALATGASFEGLELRAVRSNGAVRWFLARGEVERNEHGEAIHLLGTALDITERKLADLARSATEARHRVLMNVLPQLVWSAKASGEPLEVNDRWVEYFGATPAEMGLEGLQTLVHPDDREQSAERWETAVRSGGPLESENRLRRHDGVYRWHLARAIPVRDASGEITHWCGTCTDIHDRQLADRALREEHRRKDEFLAMLAHELRNPLAPISTAAHLLALQPADRAVVARHSETIIRNAGHLSRLVDDLLEVARINEGKIELRREPVDLTSIVRQAIAGVQGQLEARRHRLSVSLPPDPFHVYADPVRVLQILVNLLTNAVKYTEPSGDIAVTVSVDGADAVVRVRDSGQGIEPELLPRVFDLFVQGDRTLARTEGGLGVGLTLARRLAEMHGGSLDAFSAGRGCGSEFTLRLPPGQGQRPTAEPSRLDEVRPGSGRRILVVEDNRDAAETLAELLTLWDHEVRVVHDGAEALHAAAAYQPEVMLVDIGLPGMDGYEVARRVRQSPGTAGVLLVALTGYAGAPHRRQAAEAGFDHHLSKPLNLDHLQTLLAQSNDGQPPERGNL